MTDIDQSVPAPKDDRNRATRRLVGISLLAMLLVGIFLGIMIDRFVPGMRRWGRPPHGAPPGMMAQPPRRISDALARDLALTATQRSAMDSIMARHIRDFEAIRAEVGPRMKDIMGKMRAEMDSVLTPEQRTRMHERFARMRRWRTDSTGQMQDFGPGERGGRHRIGDGPPDGPGDPIDGPPLNGPPDAPRT